MINKTGLNLQRVPNGNVQLFLGNPLYRITRHSLSYTKQQLNIKDLCITQMCSVWKQENITIAFLKTNDSLKYSLFLIRMVLYHFNRYPLGLISTSLCTYHRTGINNRMIT